MRGGPGTDLRGLRAVPSGDSHTSPVALLQEELALRRGVRWRGVVGTHRAECLLEAGNPEI